MTGATDFDIATLRARLVPDDESQQSRKHEQAADRSVVELSPYPTHISPLAGFDRAKLRAAIVTCDRHRPGRVLVHSVGPLTLGLRAQPSQCTFMVKSYSAATAPSHEHQGPL
jgi:hypothetical protein